MQLFDKELREISRAIELPYPERNLLVKELAADMKSFYLELLRQGKSDTAARAEVVKFFALRKSDAANLMLIHRSLWLDVLSNINPQFLQFLGETMKVSSGIIFLTLLFREVPMITFFREGGPVVQLILAVGVSGIGLQLLRCFRWFIKRDHSDESLGKNNATPVHAAVITFLLGLMGSCLGYYVVFSKWARNEITYDEMKIGLYEPLPCLIVATALAITMVTLQLFMQVKLRSLGVPKNFLE